MDLTDLARRLIPCPRCEALPGAGCTTVTGGRSRTVHAPRTRPVYDAWRIGYSEALRDSADSAERLATSNVDAKASAVATMLRRRLDARAPVR